ncbi:hypothetical protein APTSU1_001762900 [Apodemus speciosus]|uniref:Uncharacterized protein n=1 Tax=Apodemus speciosus TaxID=105296 RepID=A0ABQ0FT39_APOSI
MGRSSLAQKERLTPAESRYRQRQRGAAMVDGKNGIWVEESLSPVMSTEKVELIALTKTLELGASRKISIHMDNSN